MKRPSRAATTLVASLLVVGTVAGVATASARTQPKSFFACESATGEVTSISTSSHIRCPGAVRVRWNSTGPRGARGATGPQGVPGARGSLWSTGSGTPTATGQNGDLYLDTSSGEVYEVVSGTWTMEANITGPQGAMGARGISGSQGLQGPQGPQGVPGARGSLWSTGSGTPTATGQSGDLYLDTSTGDVYELVAAAWVLKANIKGPQGAQGPNGVVRDCSTSSYYPGIDLAGCDLFGANLTGANLAGANLAGANLSQSSLRQVDLTGANLGGANLFEADLTNANLTGANLGGANLSEANLTDASLTGASLTGAIYLLTLCPSGTTASSPTTC